MAHKRFTLSGLHNKTRVLTEPWPELPKAGGEVWVFHFHPEGLAGEDLRHFSRTSSDYDTMSLPNSSLRRS
jgi:hypothetical protein